MTGGMLDLGELVKRAIKYLVEGLMVAIAAYAIPKKALNLDEVALIALTAAATFSILDTCSFSCCWSSFWCRFRYWSKSCKIPWWILN
jgi:hypothetical protein